MTDLKGRLRLRSIPRRLRYGIRWNLLPKLIVVILAAVVLRLFFSILGNSGFIQNNVDTDFFKTVLSAELGSVNGMPLSVFSRQSLLSGQSAILTSLPPYEFQIAADDGFDGEFSDFDTVGSIYTNPPDKANTSGEVDRANDGPPSSGNPANEYDDSNDHASDGTKSSVDNDPNVRTVTIIPSSPAGYDYADGVYIKNETSYDIDVEKLLSKKPKLDLDIDNPVILVVHTHASEAYYPEGEDIYEPTDTERTDDKNYNVVRVGDEVVSVLKDRGYEAVHIREIFDYPSYSGSYTRTLKAIEKALEEFPSIRIVLDIHRDAMVAANGSTYRTIAEIDGKNAAQILLVVGTEEGGLKHPNWRDNLTFAVHLQKQLVEDHPLLMRPINLRPERFNQHATSGSLIVEFGTSSNTLQEALYSARLFASSLCNLLDGLAPQ